jgi:hypothetical protein
VRRLSPCVDNVWVRTVCLIGSSSERLLMHEFMNDRTRLLVGYLSPPSCFTTVATVINEVAHCPIMSQSSTPIFKWFPSTSVSPTARYIPGSCVLNLTNDQEAPTCRPSGKPRHPMRNSRLLFLEFFLKKK